MKKVRARRLAVATASFGMIGLCCGAGGPGGVAAAAAAPASAPSLARTAPRPPVPPPVVRRFPDRRDPVTPSAHAPTISLPTGSWAPLGPAPIGAPFLDGGGFYGGVNAGRITAYAVINSGTHAGRVVAGTAGGGIWTSDNNGTTWTPRTDQGPSLAIGAVADDPSTPDHLIAGTGEGNQSGDSFFGEGILVSTDGGTTWTPQDPGGVFAGNHISEVAIDPTNSMKQFAASDAGLFVTTNGGATWAKPTDPSYASVDGIITAVVIDPGNPATVYLGGGAATVAKSTDGGVSWMAANTGITNPPVGTFPFTALALAPSNPAVLYASVGTFDQPGILYKTTNGGGSWSVLTNAPDYTGQTYAYGGVNPGTAHQGNYDNVLAIDPTDANHVMAGGIAAVETTDGFATAANVRNINGGGFFVASPNLLHPDFHAFAFRPDGKVWVGDDGGAFLYDPASHGVTNANGNLNVTQFYFGFNEVGGSVLAGAQDNATSRTSSPSIGAWTGIASGDGGPSAITPNHTQTQFREADQTLSITTDGFTSGSTDITPPQVFTAFGIDSLFTPPMIVVPSSADPSNPTVFYGGPDVYRTTNPSASPPTWTKVTTAGGGGTHVSAITVSTTNPLVVYAGFDNGTVQVSTNGGTSFTSLGTEPFADTFVTGLSVDPTNDKAVTASFSYSDTRSFPGQPHVAQYAYTGAPGSGTWTVITGNLPADHAVSRVVFDQGALVAATDSAVYGTSTPAGSSTSWSVVGTGLPAVQVQDLFLDPTTGVLYAVTHGRGAWKLPPVVTTQPPKLTKSFGAASIPLNGQTSLSFTVKNPNASTSLSGVGFTDSLPSGLVLSTPTGQSGSCGGGTIGATAGGTSVSLSTATLAGGASCTFSVNVTGTTGGTKNNTTSAVTSTEGGNGATASASLLVTVGSVSPPQVVKTFGASSIRRNASTTLTFKVTNPNAATALTGVAFTDNLPSGLVVATPNGLTGTCGGGTITATAGAGAASLAGATLAAASNCAFSVNVTGTVGAVMHNSVTVTSINGGTGNTSTASLTVVAPPTLKKAFGASSVPLNGSTTATFTLDSSNLATPLTGVGFTDTLPAGLVVSTPNGLTGTCGAGTMTATAGSSSVSLSGVTLAVNGGCIFSVNVTGTTPGAKHNTTSAVTSNEGGNGLPASATLDVVAPPTIAKAFGAASIPLNGGTSLSFTVSAPSANPLALTKVGFVDNLPSGLVVATPNGLTGSCGAGTITAAAGAGSVSLSSASLPAGASCTFGVLVKGTTSGTKINAVTVTSTNGGTGNTATATLVVVGHPTLSKAFGVATIPFGGTTTLTFTLANPNAGTAISGVGFTDALPAGLVTATPNGLTGSCGGGTITATAGGSAVSLSGATLGAGAGCTFAVDVVAVGVGAQDNTTSAVTSANAGTGLPATAMITVTKAPTTTTVSAMPSNPAFGTPVTFTAVVAPSGPNASGTGPTGAVSFFFDGAAAPVAVVTLDPVSGRATFTTSSIGAGPHTVTASYGGDANFVASSSTTQATINVTCTTTITNAMSAAIVAGPGSTCVIGGSVTGTVVVPRGSTLDLEGVSVGGSIVANGPAMFRMCGTTSGSVTVEQATGFVLIGDTGDDACAVNTINGALTLIDNQGGVEAIGNHVAGAVITSGNSGAGPFPEDSQPEISGNGP